MTKELDWYEDREEVLLFARVLQARGEWEGAEGVDNLLYYFEKPWKWTEEHEAWNKAGRKLEE